MSDRMDKATRSKVMASIKSQDTKIELALKPALEALGFEHQPKDVFGSPDFAHKEQMIAVFADGCFFHGCLAHYKAPEGNAAFWSEKVKRNRARDLAVSRLLEGSGWRVLRVWEHDLGPLLAGQKAPTGPPGRPSGVLPRSARVL